MPILTGTDGVQKMSKSLGNYIGIDEPASIMFEKIMRMNDSNIISYFTLLTDIDMNEIHTIEQILTDNPTTEDILAAKKKLAFEIVNIYHGTASASNALNSYGKKLADDIPTRSLKDFATESNLVDLIKDLFLLKSKGEARTLIVQGAVSIDGNKQMNPDFNVLINEGMVIKTGKSKVVKLLN